MKELIINQNDDKITLVDKNDILDALSEKTNKDNIAQVINDDSNLSTGAFIHTDNSDEYNISISSDKDIIQTGGTCNISATVKKGTTPVANKNVKFSNETNTTYKKTNSSGVATYTYTGTGKGVTDIKAKYSNLLQETFVILDCLKYDTGIDGTATEIWTKSTNANLTRGTDYSTLTETDGNTCWADTTIPFGSIKAEFDMYIVDDLSSYTFLNLRKTNRTYLAYVDNTMQLPAQEWHHIIVTITNKTLVFSNTTNARTVTRALDSDESSFIFEWNTGSTLNTIRFKDFKVYPI